MNYKFVYVTARDVAEAKHIAKQTVEERLAACANIIPEMYSVYHWDGRINEDKEAVLILKTTAEKLEALSARVKALHSYQTPCIIALDIKYGFPAYLAWLDASIKEA